MSVDHVQAAALEPDGDWFWTLTVDVVTLNTPTAGVRVLVTSAAVHVGLAWNWCRM